LYWLELLVEGKIVPPERLAALMAEANELLAIFVASGRTAKTQRAPGPAIRNPQSAIRNPGMTG